jgi:hypothetical protein
MEGPNWTLSKNLDEDVMVHNVAKYTTEDNMVNTFILVL